MNFNKFIPVKADNISRTTRISTGITEFDVATGGGIPLQGVIEITGDSGTGKTQLCLQLSVRAQMDPSKGGIGGAVAYLNSATSFPNSRFDEIVRLIPNSKKSTNYKDHVLLKSVQDISTLKFCLQNQLPLLVSNRNVKLLIIDSITSLFRGVEGLDGMQRISEIRNIGILLHQLYFQYKLGIICVNDVAANFDSGKTVPALGLAWSNLVTTRIKLSRDSKAKRKIEAVYSPIIPPSEQAFKITKEGVCWF